MEPAYYYRPQGAAANISEHLSELKSQMSSPGTCSRFGVIRFREESVKSADDLGGQARHWNVVVRGWTGEPGQGEIGDCGMGLAVRFASL